MLNKEIFNNGINKLVIEYSDKGFTMSKERAEQWYSYLSKIDDVNYISAIDSTLETINKTPTMADVAAQVHLTKSKYIDRSNYKPGD